MKYAQAKREGDSSSSLSFPECGGQIRHILTPKKAMESSLCFGNECADGNDTDTRYELIGNECDELILWMEGY
jgi:hypothetical protein